MRKLGCLGVLVVAGVLALLIAVQFAEEPAANTETAASAAGVPPRMMAAYQYAVDQVAEAVPRCRGMRWPVLAGVAQIESNQAQGRRVSPDGQVRPRIIGPALDGSPGVRRISDTDGGRWDGDSELDRAVGPFQFLPATFRAVDDRAPVRDPHDVDDAALAAAVYVCGDGRNLADDSQLRSALFAYNNSSIYVDDVMGWIRSYDALADTPPDGASEGAQTVIDAAMSQRGVPYSWGGGTASGPSHGVCCSGGGQDGSKVLGYDCAGLTEYAYARAGVRLPRPASAQASVGRRIPASAGMAALKPGDLVFFAYSPGRDASIHHVGIYLGRGKMINAARPGTRVRVEPVWDSGFAGGARVL